MTKVVSMARTSEYWISRARKHRLAGRYDEAMALLAKTREQYGTGEALERELAQTYDEMGCEEEAARAYLRVARMKGEYRAEALFQLALSAAQRAELVRAASYFDQFEKSDRRHVSPDLVALLGQQLRQALEKPTPQTRRERAKALERRAVERLQGGRVYAARRTMLHAIDLLENAQRLMLLACCELILGRLDEAQTHAEQAHALAPARVQTLCVLVDVLYATGKTEQARRMLHIAVLRAQSVDERLNVAVESAKHGEDGLTLRLTRSLLRRDPYCMRGMMLRGCALMNLRRFDEAKRVFGRLCVLLPEDTVCQAYYAMARNEQPPEGRLMLGLDVSPEEAVNRAMRIISAMAETPLQGTRELYELSAWALRSAIAGTNTALLAMMLMSALETPEALDKICEEYNRVIGNMELEPLIAIPIFIHDFLCIHPFNDGNGRMSRLLTTLLLYQNGFFVGKYISLEAKIAQNKDLYYDALVQSQNGWHEGTENALPFIKYLLGTILAAYKDLDERVALVETKLPALEMVRRASKNKIGRFNKQDIRELCPTLSDSSIEGALRKLVSGGELKKEGKGKSTRYYRLK